MKCTNIDEQFLESVVLFIAEVDWRYRRADLDMQLRLEED